MAPLPWLTTIFFSLAVPPALYALYAHHNRHGLLGWLCLVNFCVLRIVGNVMRIKADDQGATYSATGVEVVNDISTAPLLLAGVGILHEARRARNLDVQPGLEWLFLAAYHAVVGAALVLMVTGITQVVNRNLEPSGVIWTSQTSTWLKGAMALLFVCWGFLLAGILFSLRLPGNAVRPAAYNDGTKLLYAILFILPFLLCTIIYGALSFFLYDPNFATLDNVKAVMSFVPEVIATVVLLWAGLATREMWSGTPSKVKEAAMESNGWYALEDVPERSERIEV